MSQRFQTRYNNFQENSKIKYEHQNRRTQRQSYNLLKIILEAKIQTDIQARALKLKMLKQSKLDRQHSRFSEKQENEKQISQFQAQNFESFNENKVRTNKKKIEKIESQGMEDKKYYQGLLKRILEIFSENAESVKKELKKAKGLPIDEEFIPENSHKCQYCGTKFAKPCSLGGHISKLHAQERKRDKMMSGKKDFVETATSKKH